MVTFRLSLQAFYWLIIFLFIYWKWRYTARRLFFMHAQKDVYFPYRVKTVDLACYRSMKLKIKENHWQGKVSYSRSQVMPQNFSEN